MSEGIMPESDVESLRKDIGEKMARDGEGYPGDHASDSLKSGFKRGAIGWGSNTTPRLFGKGGNEPEDWECICGTLNLGRVRYKKANRIICKQCGIEKDLALEASVIDHLKHNQKEIDETGT